LEDALAHYQKALDISNELGHRSSAALAIHAIGLTLADQGDLPGAYKMLQQALAIQHDIGEKSNYADSLRTVGQVLMQRGDLEQARKLFDQALAEQQKLGEMGNAAESRLALAELDCDSGRAKEGEQLALDAVHTFQTQHEPDDEIFATAMLSRALLEQGKIQEAGAMLEAPMKAVKKSSDVTTRLTLTLAEAGVLEARNDLTAAERAVRQVLAEAPKDLFKLRLEASLRLAEIQSKGKNRGLGRRRLQEISRSAREKGFELIARRASAAQNQ
jgi:tetratricopeptide (TPR) repeat protein